MAICSNARAAEADDPSISAKLTALVKTDIAVSNRLSAINDRPSNVITHEGEAAKEQKKWGIGEFINNEKAAKRNIPW
jgi:hypothetical protein